MRHKRKSFKGKLSIFSMMLIIILSVYLATKNIPNQQQTAILQGNKEYKTLTYIITEIEDNRYYGKSEDRKTRISFTREDLIEQEQIQVEDAVLAYFEPDNLIKLIGVEKIDE